MMTREEARQRALRRAVRKRKGRSGPTDSAPTRLEKIQLERPTMTIGQMQRLKERKLRERRLREQSMQARPGMLTGGQAKLDKNKNNKIDAQDFKILRAEKEGARGRGKVTKAALGVLAAGLSAKKRMKNKKMAPVGMGAIGAGTAKLDAIKKILGKNKGGMGEAKGYKKYLKGLKKAEGEQFRAKFKAKEIAKAGGKAAMNAAKASRLGKIALTIAAAGLGAKEFLKRKMEKNKNQPQKKMGGGMMMRRPMMANKGVMTEKDKQEKKLVKRLANSRPMDRRRIKDRDIVKGMGGYMGGGLTEATQRLKAQGKMGGGMMMRPNPVGMKSGKSVKVKCKLGRNKPTKMY